MVSNAGSNDATTNDDVIGLFWSIAATTEEFEREYEYIYCFVRIQNRQRSTKEATYVIKQMGLDDYYSTYVSHLAA